MPNYTILKLYDIKEGSKIYCECSDGSKYITFYHIDGMYSYNISAKGAVVHLYAAAKLRKYRDGYRIILA